MIDGKQYIETVKLYFSFLINEFDFIQTNEIENGNAFYDVEYKNSERAISVSYENIEDYLQVIVFKLKNGKLPDYDDKSHTLHLDYLNKTIMPLISKSEINSNNKFFEKFEPNSNIEKKLLKTAKELRLCLKHYNLIA